MSISISIQNNRDFCRANGLVEQEVYPCDHCDYAGKVSPDCMECQGKGNVSFDRYPFDLNVSNSNFATVWSALGFDADDCGEMEPILLLDALRSTAPEMFHKPEERGTGAKGATWIECGTGADRANRYYVELEKIATEAIRRGEKIDWA